MNTDFELLKVINQWFDMKKTETAWFDQVLSYINQDEDTRQLLSGSSTKSANAQMLRAFLKRYSLVCFDVFDKGSGQILISRRPSKVASPSGTSSADKTVVSSSSSKTAYEFDLEDIQSSAELYKENRSIYLVLAVFRKCDVFSIPAQYFLNLAVKHSDVAILIGKNKKEQTAFFKKHSHIFGLVSNNVCLVPQPLTFSQVAVFRKLICLLNDKLCKTPSLPVTELYKTYAHSNRVDADARELVGDGPGFVDFLLMHPTIFCLGFNNTHVSCLRKVRNIDWKEVEQFPLTFELPELGSSPPVFTESKTAVVKSIVSSSSTKPSNENELIRLHKEQRTIYLVLAVFNRHEVLSIPTQYFLNLASKCSDVATAIGKSKKEQTSFFNKHSHVFVLISNNVVIIPEPLSKLICFLNDKLSKTRSLPVTELYQTYAHSDCLDDDTRQIIGDGPGFVQFLSVHPSIFSLATNNVQVSCVRKVQKIDWKEVKQFPLTFDLLPLGSAPSLEGIVMNVPPYLSVTMNKNDKATANTNVQEKKKFGFKSSATGATEAAAVTSAKVASFEVPKVKKTCMTDCELDRVLANIVDDDKLLGLVCSTSFVSGLPKTPSLSSVNSLPLSTEAKEDVSAPIQKCDVTKVLNNKLATNSGAFDVTVASSDVPDNWWNSDSTKLSQQASVSDSNDTGIDTKNQRPRASQLTATSSTNGVAILLSTSPSNDEQSAKDIYVDLDNSLSLPPGLFSKQPDYSKPRSISSAVASTSVSALATKSEDSECCLKPSVACQTLLTDLDFYDRLVAFSRGLRRISELLPGPTFDKL